MKKKNLEFKLNDNGCFSVISHRLNKDGYCYFHHNKKFVRAHRLIYEECFGEIPKDLVVRHKCDNRCCINPEHLELGTQKDNALDAVKRGRTIVGEAHKNSVLTEEISRKIKAMLNAGMMPLQISKELNVGLYSVRGIKRQRTWKHVSV